MSGRQRDAIFAPAQYVVIEASTKTGKTTGYMVWLLEQAMLGSARPVSAEGRLNTGPPRHSIAPLVAAPSSACPHAHADPLPRSRGQRYMGSCGLMRFVSDSCFRVT
jgi:hypothetical protein